jgi:hypothetical protein
MLVAGRKMQQLSNQLGSAATAAQSDTAAKIAAAIDNHAQVKPSQAPKLGTTASVQGATSGTSGTVTSTIASAPKTTRGSGGAATNMQGATGAKINAAASGTKPTKPPAAQGPKVTTTIANAPKSTQGGAGAGATAAQAGTAAAINAAASGAKPAAKP